MHAGERLVRHIPADEACDFGDQHHSKCTQNTRHSLSSFGPIFAHLSCSHAHELWRLEGDAASLGQLWVVDVEQVLGVIQTKPREFAGRAVVEGNSFEAGQRVGLLR